MCRAGSVRPGLHHSPAAGAGRGAGAAAAPTHPSLSILRVHSIPIYATMRRRRRVHTRGWPIPFGEHRMGHPLKAVVRRSARRASQLGDPPGWHTLRLTCLLAQVEPPDAPARGQVLTIRGARRSAHLRLCSLVGWLGLFDFCLLADRQTARQSDDMPTNRTIDVVDAIAAGQRYLTGRLTPDDQTDL